MQPSRQLRSSSKSDIISSSQELADMDALKQTAGESAEDFDSLSIEISGESKETQGNLMKFLQNLNKKIDNLTTDICEVKNDMKLIKEAQKEWTVVQQTASNAHDIATECKQDVTQLTTHIKALEKQLNETKSESKSTYDELKKLKEDHVKLDTYIRRDNLIFKNIPATNEDNAESTLRNFLKGLGIDNADTMPFARVHRLKPNKKKSVTDKTQPAPIICRFELYNDRMKVWNKRSKLKGSNVQIHEDFHPDVMQKRLSLYPIMKEARKCDMLSTLSQDKLIIDGNAYTVNSLDKLPSQLMPVAMGFKESPQAIAFFTKRCAFSNA